MGIQPSAAFSETNKNQPNKRRTARMGLNALVRLSGQDRQKFQFTMPARAINLNRYGAAVQLPRELEVGSTVMVQNKYGHQLSARVIAQLNVLEGGVRTYGIEFVEEGDGARDFWGISFPA